MQAQQSRAVKCLHCFMRGPRPPSCTLGEEIWQETEKWGSHYFGCCCHFWHLCCYGNRDIWSTEDRGEGSSGTLATERYPRSARVFARLGRVRGGLFVHRPPPSALERTPRSTRSVYDCASLPWLRPILSALTCTHAFLPCKHPNVVLIHGFFRGDKRERWGNEGDVQKNLT